MAFSRGTKKLWKSGTAINGYSNPFHLQITIPRSCRYCRISSPIHYPRAAFSRTSRRRRATIISSPGWSIQTPITNRGMPVSVNLQTVHPRKLAAVHREVAPGAVGSAWGAALGKVWEFIRNSSQFGWPSET